MKTFYIGRFPPPYGGVTIKNKMLYENLLQRIDIEKVELGLIKSMNLREIVKLFTSLVNPSNIFIIGSAGRSRRNFSWLLYHINRKALNRSLLIVMGGVSSRIIADDPKYLKWVSEFKQVYVETESMKVELTDLRMTNVSVFPNCRERPEEFIEVKNTDKQKIKCLYFSLISKDKGADIVIEAAKILNKRGIDFSIDFYGHVEEKYKIEFEKNIEILEHVNYYGVFRADKESVYSKLQQYDMLLFPTRCKTEGVPGVLVEAKIASLPAIVSDICYNSEIIKDKKDGIVLNENSSDELANAIEYVCSKRNWLMEMKKNAKISGEDYLIENYIEDIFEIIKGREIV